NAPGTGAIVHIFLTCVTRIVRGPGEVWWCGPWVPARRARGDAVPHSHTVARAGPGHERVPRSKVSCPGRVKRAHLRERNASRSRVYPRTDDRTSTRR